MRSTFKGRLNATIDEVATLLEKDGSVDFIRAINGPFTGRYRNINFNHYIKDFRQLTLQYVSSRNEDYWELAPTLYAQGAINYMTSDV